MLEALISANGVSDGSQIELYRLAFPNGLSILNREVDDQRRAGCLHRLVVAAGDAAGIIAAGA